VLWAHAVARSGHRAGATLLYERLLPWHDQFATPHTVVTGGVAPWHCAGAEAGLASGICMTRIPEDSRNLRRSKWWRETLNVKEA